MIRIILPTIVLLSPLVALAQTTGCVEGAAICTFQQLPFLDNAANLTTEDYVNALYRMAISIAAILVVLRLIWAGVQYMLSEVVTSKEKAKKDIQGALLGLLIVLGAVTILNTINPQITQTDILSRLESAGGKKAELKTPPPTYQQSGMGMIEANNKAEECGGTFKKLSNGNFEVTCPGTAPTTPPAGKHQLSGYPMNLNSHAELFEGIDQCRRAGGSPASSEITYNKFVLNCYN